MKADSVWFIEVDIHLPNIRSLLNTSARIVKKHQECAIPQRQVTISGQGLKERIDLIAFQVDGFLSRGTFGRNGFHSLSFGQHFWVMNGEVTIERAQSGKPLVSRAWLISTLFLNRA